jgi:hypothetical protein
MTSLHNELKYLSNEIIRSKSKHMKNKEQKLYQYLGGEESLNNNNEASYMYTKLKNNIDIKTNNDLLNNLTPSPKNQNQKIEIKINQNQNTNLNTFTYTNTNNNTNTINNTNSIGNININTTNTKANTNSRNKFPNLSTFSEIKTERTNVNVNVNDSNTYLNQNQNLNQNLNPNSQLEKKLKNSSNLKTTELTIKDKDNNKFHNKGNNNDIDNDKYIDKDIEMNKEKNQNLDISDTNIENNLLRSDSFQYSKIANEINKNLTNYNFFRSKKMALEEILDEKKESENNFYKSIKNNFKVFNNTVKKKIFDYDEIYMKKSNNDGEEKKLKKEKIKDINFNKKMDYEIILKENLKEMEKRKNSNKKSHDNNSIDFNDKKFLKFYENVERNLNQQYKKTNK